MDFRSQLRRAILLQIITSIAILLFAMSHAGAHDRWADGSPVPAWVKQFCCGYWMPIAFKGENGHAG